MNNFNYNGRIDIINNTLTSNYNNNLYTEDNNPNKNFHSEALKGIQTESLLSRTFFSDKNIDIIQNSIRYNVYNLSNSQYIIARQSDIQLQIIMRSLYLQFSKNLNTGIREQVQELNNMVVNYCVPRILSEIQQYIVYKSDVSKLPEPIDRSLNLSVKGTKTLILKTL
jgi:hypothetical protein